MGHHLVTGGAGFIGGNIARRLLARGEKVRVLDIAMNEQVPPDAEQMVGDITDPAVCRAAMDGIDYVHHNAALVPLTKSGTRFRDVNLGGTQRLLEAAEQAGVKFFAHMSSSAIFGSPDQMPITNDTPLAPVEIYGASKRDADVAVQEAGRQGMAVACIRPRTVVGAYRLGIFGILFDWIHDHANIYVIGDGNQRFQFVHVDDIADVSIEACLQEKPGLYNVGTNEFGTLREDLSALIAYAGSRSRVKGLPVGLTIGTLTALDKLGLSPLGPWHYKTYHKPFYFDTQPVTDALGWRPQYSNQQLMTQAYDWYVANRDQVRQGKSIHRSPVKQGILKLLKAVS